MSTVGQNIKKARENHNLTQEELAFKLRVGLARVEKYESGEQIPDTNMILLISTVLDVPTSELIAQ
ncbi:helix-turn-helix domain-containing protein [Bacillus massilinigeriensis]|uniref:helix-turn-helix domain-containing protein n=1 Tax=Bacillus massilionigeriensis TaxID=1805475 RepID=UPI00096B66B0|nr:helix-turn-helix transcriptional regulator [Bacillus massilionigeriensis]